MGRKKHTGRTNVPKGEGFPNKINFLIACVSLLFPFGWSVSGFPPNILLACGCWAATLGAILHFFWKWSGSTERFGKLKWVVVIGLPVAILAFARKPVAHQYHEQHYPHADTNIAAMKEEMHNFVVTARSNQTHLSEQMDTLAQMMENDHSYSPEVRAAFAGQKANFDTINADIDDVDSWGRNLTNEFNLKQIQEEINNRRLSDKRKMVIEKY